MRLRKEDVKRGMFITCDAPSKAFFPYAEKERSSTSEYLSEQLGIHRHIITHHLEQLEAEDKEREKWEFYNKYCN